MSLSQRNLALLLIAPGLALVAALFLYPLCFSLISAFTGPQGGFSLQAFGKAWELYSGDVVFTVVIVLASCFFTGLAAIIIAGTLTLGENRYIVGTLKALYRWPLFIPFIVAAQCMRTFLAKNGLMNNTFVSMGLMEPLQAVSFLDWRGIIATFVWKQTPFVALLLAGALAALDRATLEAGRNLGASRMRVLVELALPQVMPQLLVALVLSFVTMLSVLSVPMMVAGSQPTMLTVDMAFRINAYGDYATANALGVITYLISAGAAIIYLKRGMAKEGTP
ncbi:MULTISPECIES: ABC transporter permease [Bosea]|uniref:ABC transporter permease n=1 Tax=Bosea TaxID=85413 RepID=UPI00214F7C2D|nr:MULTISPECIES: ABC transporter permease subunit [Bosea]MCR4523265.1 ABC transporter permease subunit [Bosea sp. 47.2.35]MDR6830257.1 ABC-type sugar transport system permease subunit [Bosea robiniae]MDR6895590.1 ABC-type sugar transport system permease subunit [Bosea sp. BE109]MDR7138985.1 ABC-type sugar transport system permease subunit [Bosea sp. BE168]MDR7175686.1 ABC-type sugar transport system permease subunit [Bosea sp. BE271]